MPRIAECSLPFVRLIGEILSDTGKLVALCLTGQRSLSVACHIAPRHIDRLIQREPPLCKEVGWIVHPCL